MTPAYPKMQQSYVKGVYVTKMKLFNRREDVEYYEIQVFTNEWKPLPFASTSKVLNVGHNRRKLFEVYILNQRYLRTQNKLHLYLLKYVLK